MSSKSLVVNCERIEAADIRALAGELRLERGADSLEERLALLEEAKEQLIERALVLQEARRVRLTTAELIARWRAAVRAPGAEEARNYYRKNQQRFWAPETIHASHIVSESEASVRDWRARVSAGEDFKKIAKEYSDCPENNGDLGWFARGVMVEEFDEAVFPAPLNELTPVFRTVFGFHFALVHARRAEGVRAFAEVREELQRNLWLEKQDREIGRQLQELRAKAEIRGVE